jgi:hypothetical protein
MGKDSIGSYIVPIRVYSPDTEIEDSILGLLELRGWIPEATRPRSSAYKSDLSVFYLGPKDFGPFARDLVSVALLFGLEVEEVGGHYTLIEKSEGN